MTVADVMDAPLDRAEETDLARELAEANRKLDVLVDAMERLHHRVESLEELREDLWPMVEGASHQIAGRLHELERNGTLGFIRESVRMAGVVATSFSEEDVRLLAENVVTILRTVRNLTQPEVLEVADRAATALQQVETAPDRKVSLLRALRDPEVRRGMTLMLTVLRELGHEGSNENETALVAD